MNDNTPRWRKPIDDLQAKLAAAASHLDNDERAFDDEVTFGNVVRRAAHLLKSHEGNRAGNRAREERQAWDRYAAAAIDFGVARAATYADDLLTERRKRFPPPDEKEQT